MEMKYFLLAFAIGALTLQSCSDDNDEVKNVPETVKSAFAQKYPETAVREWDKKSGMYVAEFRNENSEAEAWFTSSGSWLKTETDYVGALPEAVKDYITANYPTATIDDTDLIETATDRYFKIELEQRKKEDIDLYIRADGTVLKVVDGNKPAAVTEAVKEAFAQKYPGVTVREWEEKMNYFVAEFSINNSEAEAWFTSDGLWVRTETDYRGTLPEAVKSYITNNYPEASIDDVDLISTPSGEYYEVELERRGSADIELNIRADGTLVI